MAFLSSFFLYALPAAALPIVVHLLAKRRRKVIAWGAMQFLAQANPRARRSWRLKDLLLLALRVLVLICFIVALARPLVPAGWLGGHHTRDVILVVDQSMSMQWEADGTTVYEQAMELVATSLSELDPTDFLRCLVAAESPQWLTSFPLKADAAAIAGLMTELRDQELGEGAADIVSGLEEAWAAEPAHADAERHVIVITDGQAFGWMPEATGRLVAVAQMKAQFPEGSETRCWRVRRSPGERLSNMAVTSLVPSREMVARGEPVELVATVRNSGGEASPTAILEWQLNGEESLGLATVPALDAGASTTIKLEHAISSLGRHRITGSLESGDGLAADDVATAFVEVAEGIPILLVEDKAVDGNHKASHYLEAALGSFRNAEEGGVFRGAQVPPASLDEVRLGDYRAVVLTDVNGLTASGIADLKAFVQRGGGLLLAPNALTDATAFNALFGMGEASALAPVGLGEVTGDPSQRKIFEVVSPPTRLHPATGMIADTERLDLDEIRIYRRHRFAEPLPSDLSVLLRAGDGHPLVVEKALGRGRVLLVGIPLNRQWSNLPLLQVYVAMTYEWLWYLTEPGLDRLNLTSGEVFEVFFPDRPKVDQVRLTVPGLEKSESLAVLGDAMGQKFSRATETTIPGSYRMEAFSGGEAVAAYQFHVKREARESQLVTLDEPVVQQLQSRAGLVFEDQASSSDRQGAAQEVPQRRQEPIWFWLLVGVILFLIGESLLAYSIAKSRTLTSPGAQLTRAR